MCAKTSMQNFDGKLSKNISQQNCKVKKVNFTDKKDGSHHSDQTFPHKNADYRTN